MRGLLSERLWWPVLGLCIVCPVQAAGDVARGENVFKTECAECHSPRDGKNKKGPSLFAVLGRKAGTVAGFEYSVALRDTGWMWDDERLRSYLSQPAKKANPGGKMKYDGVAEPKALSDLIAYLGSLK